MSTPHEASLTEKERAILAGLAAQAEADDPSLAATLRGRARRVGKAPGLVTRLRVPAAVSHWAWGVVLGVAGLVLMVASLGVGLVVGLVGVALTFVGTYRVVVARPRREQSGGDRQGTPVSSDN